MRGLNDDEIVNFVRLTETKDVEVRFIEYMPFDGNKWNDKKMVPYSEMLETIRKELPALEKVLDAPNDTSKVLPILVLHILNK
jgi:molybdenum cofactor biosynthesis enzyme MoaA